MSQDVLLLSAGAATIGAVHTLLGPDHYLPFIMMARAGAWSTLRTVTVTFLCGLGHVGSSVVLGALGIATGIMVGRLESLEAVRGEFAAYLLMIFGIVYTFWGLWRALRPKPHKHAHFHDSDRVHIHTHDHLSSHGSEAAGSDHEHGHPAETIGSKTSMTPWVLFIIFVLGPCEPLIPMLMYPASKNSWHAVALVAVVFSVVTVSTMLAVVLAGLKGLRYLRLGLLERFVHFIAGLTIALCGAAILFLGL